MRHRIAGRRLGRTTSHRQATMRNLTQSLFERDRIRTTLTKAKEMRPFAERLNPRMNTLTSRQYISRLMACVAGLVILVIISPGIGSTSDTYGWWDVWRAKLGMKIDVAELLNRPLVDLDGDGVISERERAGYVIAARRIFSQRFPRTLLALQVGATLALCGAVFQILFRNDRWS